MHRPVVAAALALSLSACAAVSSERPLFGPADAASAPVPRLGVWMAPSPGCRFSSRAPVGNWPDCANGMVLGAAEIQGGALDATGGFTQTLRYSLAGGDPPLMQVFTPANRDPADPAIVYVGLRPLASDEDGRITQARVWLVLCHPPVIVAGPPPAKSPKPIPGVTPVKGRDYCLAKTQTALRTVLRQSEAWAFTGSKDDYGLVARWVRDTDR